MGAALQPRTDDTFELPCFEPAPLLANPHLQSLWPFFFRRVPSIPIVTERWSLPDHESLAVHLGERPGPRPGVVVVHGLESSSEAQYVRGLLGRIHRAGWNGAAFDLRSCGTRALPTRVAYHAGKTDDLIFVLERLCARWPGAPLAVVGFSLGGNLVLKCLGELGASAPVQAAVAVSVPFDLARCATAVDGPGFWNTLYRTSILLSLKRKALALALRESRGARRRLDPRAVLGVRTFADFDTHVTARLFGFTGAADYRARASAAPFLTAIRRPTLLIAAQDDPLVPADAIPQAQIASNPALTLWLTERGGHLGFVGGTLRRPVYVAEEATMAFLASRFAEPATTAR